MKTRNGIELLRRAMIENDSLACCGLDPVAMKLPMEFRGGWISEEEGLRKFLEIVVDLTAPHICAYKAQKAFFDILPGGHRLLKGIITYIHNYHPEIPIFIDAKIGDVGNTMAIYLRNMFEELEADGVVVNPYLGDDVMRPFEKLPHKAAIVTVKTSNPDAAIVQDVALHDGRPLWKYILELMVGRWNGAGNMIPVIGSTIDVDLKDVRRSIPESMPVLFAGYGAQGGSLAHIRDLVDVSGRGVFVNSSRGLLYPYDIHEYEWRSAVTRATVQLKDALNFERSRSKFLLLFGVSGVGKSTIIRELRKLDDRFVYISPFMTRELRAGESDKNPITDTELDAMNRRGELLVVNQLYGVRYATPREPIIRAFREGKFPLLDWPIDRFAVMQAAFPEKLFRVYVEPPSVEVLRQRLADGRDPDSERIGTAVSELTSFASGVYDEIIDFKVVSQEGGAASIARSIYHSFLQSMG